MSVPQGFANLGEGVWEYSGSIGPVTVTISNTKLTRFMDRLYIPCPTNLLSPEQIVVINRFRDRMLYSDSQFDYRHKLRSLITDVVRKTAVDNLLEIGCGRYPLGPDVLIRRYFALEIDSDAANSIVSSGISCFSSVSELLGTLSTIDLVLALFVMHFRVADDLVDALALSTSPEAILIFNVVAKEATIRHDVASRLIERGMWVSGFRVLGSGVNDTIFVATKLKSFERGADALDRLRSLCEKAWPSN